MDWFFGISMKFWLNTWFCPLIWALFWSIIQQKVSNYNRKRVKLNQFFPIWPFLIDKIKVRIVYKNFINAYHISYRAWYLVLKHFLRNFTQKSILSEGHLTKKFKFFGILKIEYFFGGLKVIQMLSDYPFSVELAS